MKSQASALYPFVPSSPNFGTAIAFFAELGSRSSGRTEGAPAVDDLEAYWAKIDAKDLPGRFPGVRTKPPTDYPWGREVHIIDPAGVCWHVRQSAQAQPR